ncbi:MAG: NUDIX hydrolase [Verrucomicrobiota bacterium]
MPPDGKGPMACTACGFRLYFNPAVAVAVFVQDAAGRVLLIRRAKEPGAGKLAPPGGFIDVGERAEDAVHREVHEEVGLRLTDLRFLASQPNEYLFGGVLYPVLDLFFTARLADPAAASGEVDAGEVEAVGWHAPSDVAPGDLAFPSMRAAWQDWLRANPAFAGGAPGDRVRR